MRQIVLDTETTGLSPAAGHRLTEIGCLEIVNRKLTGEKFHSYINPERDLDAKAAEITGLTREFLQDKPKFVDIVDPFLEFIKGADLIIHNAPFDVGFLNHELRLMQHSWQAITSHTEVVDTLVMAKNMYPGQRNNLDALCKRLNVNNSHRDLHGALLDAELLAKVYLAMTAGQISINFDTNFTNRNNQQDSGFSKQKITRSPGSKLKVITTSDSEEVLHNEYLQMLEKLSGGACVWNKTDP